MVVLIIKNIVREGPGLLEEKLNHHQISYSIVNLDDKGLFPDAKKYSAVFVFGGPDSANDATIKMQNELRMIKKVVDAEIPYLGVCLGMQMLVKANCGEVYKNRVKEIGWKDQEGDYYKIELTEEGRADYLFAGVRSPLPIFHLHGETVRLTKEMKLLAVGKYCRNQAVKFGKNAYGLQGHLELIPTMFEEWLREDPDLINLERQALRNNYEKIRNEYETAGKQVLTNFLRIAKLIN